MKKKLEQSNYSVVHNGPIKYCKTYEQAYNWREKQYERGYFLDPDTRKKILVNRNELIIFNLNLE